MQVEEELARFKPERDTVLTIGVFDGVHLGHQHLIRYVIRQALAKDYLAGVVTFRNHPLDVLAPHQKRLRLTAVEERTRLMLALGMNFVVPLTFTPELARLPARDFVILLQEKLNMKGLVIGPDFALGRQREGNVFLLRQLGKELGFWVEVMAPMMVGGEIASSTRTREALAQGDMPKVRQLLGRNYTLKGSVGHGDERGRELGFPTANLEVNSGQAIPADGVYATRAHLGNEVYPAVTNIGMRPTFGGTKRTVEIYLLDFQGSLYGQDLRVELVDRLRPEKRFANAQELTAQISNDIEEARAILGRSEP